MYYLKIDPNTIRGIIELFAAGLMFVGLLSVVWHRLKQGLGLSNISLQFVSVIFVFPTILILSLEQVLKGETAGTLIGTLAGYLFSEFGKNKPNNLYGPNSEKRKGKPFTDSQHPDFEETQP